VKTAMKYLFPV